MVRNKKFEATLALLLLAVCCYGQSSKTSVDYLNIGGPIVLNKESFNLSWTSHPAPEYYKQEYILPKDRPEKYKKMVLVEVLVGEVSASDLAKGKIAELKQLKVANPLVNHDVFQKNGEIIVDFLLSENSADGKSVLIIERNVYRYKQITEKNGKKGVMLFGISERAYGNDVNAFLSSLKKTKPILLNAVAAYPIPEIQIRK